MTDPADAAASLGLHFDRPELLREALTHRSAAHDQAIGLRNRRPGEGSNERLEFIGDRVLGLVMAEWLAELFPREQEGELGQRHAHLVSRPVLAGIAQTLGLSSLLAVSPNEGRAGITHLATVLADTVEAVIGALYYDAGLAAARVFIRTHWRTAIDAQAEPPKDAKTALQEHLLGRHCPLPRYETVATEGPPHAPTFTVRVEITGADGLQCGTGQAGNKREAERLAAADLLARLQ